MKYLLILFLFVDLLAYSQGSTKNQQKKYLDDLRKSEQLLKKASNNVRLSVKNLQLLSNQINTRELLLFSIEKEIEFYTKKIALYESDIIFSERKIEKLKKEYRKLLYYAYRNRNMQQKIIFILSASDFNQAYIRLRYFQQFSEHLKLQAQAIQNLQNEVSQKIVDLKALKEEKTIFLQQKTDEIFVLEEEKAKKVFTVENLKKKRKEIIADIERKRKQNQHLLRTVEKTVETTKSTEATLTVTQKNWTKKFEQSKGKLGWPVHGGVVISSFGEHKHPVLEKVTVRNDGIDIGAKVGALVVSIFDGKVVSILTIPGANRAVIVNHGLYFSVYSNVKLVYVKKGQLLARNEKIGTVASADGGQLGVLNFQIWKNTEKLNPQVWLKRK